MTNPSPDPEQKNSKEVLGKLEMFEGKLREVKNPDTGAPTAEATIGQRLRNFAAELVGEAFVSDMHDHDRGVREIEKLTEKFEDAILHFMLAEERRKTSLQRPTQSTLLQGEAWDAAGNRHYGPVERRAAEIYATYEYAAGKKPDWVPHGNSLKQDEARNTARRELRDLGHIPVATKHLHNEEAPGAEAVAITAKIIRQQCCHAADGREFREPDSEKLAKSILGAALRSIPVPAPGVIVTDEMVQKFLQALLNFHIDLRSVPDCVCAALSAALRPKE